VMVVAKNDMAHHRLAMKFKAREMRKAYVAVCYLQEPIEAGVIDAPIGRSFRHRKKMAIRYDGGRAAITEYEIREALGSFAVVDAYPRSGRTHQIRVHLSFMGLPIVCDQLYGRERALYETSVLCKARLPGEEPILERHALHARLLAFEHPRTGRPLIFESAPPADMEYLLGFLRRCFPSSRP
jgi:23S rRNA pseudouridine1911/1915/1917 synthase